MPADFSQAILMSGFVELQRSLETISSKSDFGIEYELQRRLRRIGDKVARDAPAFVTHATGRHGEGMRLEESVRVSVTKHLAMVYSESVYGGVQNFGGGPKAGWAARGPHVRRVNASKWMTRAVQANREYVAGELDGVLDFVKREFEHEAGRV